MCAILGHEEMYPFIHGHLMLKTVLDLVHHTCQIAADVDSVRYAIRHCSAVSVTMHAHAIAVRATNRPSGSTCTCKKLSSKLNGQRSG